MTTFDDKEFDHIYEQEINAINEQLEQEIVLALIGDVNSGKSSTINQLMGDDVARVGAQPGETRGIKKYNYKDKIIFADTPGLDDINQAHSKETLAFYKEADIVLFFLNAAGTVFSDGEKQALEKIEAVNKNIIIVLNKIDAADNIPDLVNYIQAHTKAKYKVTPVSSRTGENIDILAIHILAVLKSKKKDVLFAKYLKEKATVANKWINAAAVSATAVGAAPLPGADIIPLTGIQVGLMVKLATLYEKPMTKDRAKELAIATFTGNIGRGVFRQVTKFIPGAGSIAGASIAGSMTLGLGHSIKYAYENNIDLDTNGLKSIYALFMRDKQKQLES
ncbi:GTP-binding protein Era [Amphibacillus marinus]|uniref:GTP-binding protein Era n=1 Tax=Amphibacillus marinus TaxID=872970 RepID=A0A1H8T8C0_9BACI|nr:GTPase [Amphibacillus marinus]SEO87152.1 GTP-binding protein Era [Amphibacillus marinus]